MNGYRHPHYVYSLQEFGTPLHLPHADGWILQRQIPGGFGNDAMGCYPLFTCANWSFLPRDLEDLPDNLVSVVLVTDPFGDFTLSDLQKGFDVVSAFKEHFVVDFQRSDAGIISKHHRYYTRRALAEVEVEVCREPADFFYQWHALYSVLVKRHRIMGIRAFSKASFALQLCIPGTVIFRATHLGETVSAHWYFEQNEVAYSHLAASSPAGYACGAAYALHWYAIDYFRDRVRHLDLGAGLGAGADRAADGLTQFKQGWANDTRTVYLCGRVVHPERYKEIVHARKVAQSDYFPLYRKDEFT